MALNLYSEEKLLEKLDLLKLNMIKINFKRMQLIYDISEVVALYMLCRKIVPDQTASFPHVKDDILCISSLSNVRSIQRVK